ncbi:MAG: sigma 54-interacting transcriptional regulator [Chitinophagaceae bacterium]|nr:sigma 54-interacting transcriptional regulator [Chitinophagaceae bacterium]
MKPNDLLEYFLKNPGRFSILILGERGIGKTKWVKSITVEKLKKVVIQANCAAFSEDTMAESELFGHKKGSFTGAIEDKKGLFIEAANNVLFLDEVHALLPNVQQKLMTALQTESSGANKGKFCIRRLGDGRPSYVSVIPVFASNLPLTELKKKLLPDLYDRISQLVVEFPSIHESKLDIHNEFKKIWSDMQFEEYPVTPALSQFIKWLKRIPLEGNYRTLQNIAINWHQFRLIEYNESKDYDKEKEEKVFMSVKEQISSFHSANPSIKNTPAYNFRKGISKKEMKMEYDRAMLEWAFSEDGYGEKQTDVQKGLTITSRVKNPNIK